MKTQDLIEALALDAGPAPTVSSRLGSAAGLGMVVALPLMAIWLGLRPDLSDAMGTMMFWTKTTYTAILSLAGFWCVEQLSRPLGSARRGVALGVSIVAVLLVAGLWQFMSAAPAEQMPILMGRSWTRCPRNVLVLALPILAATLWVVRGMAPTRLASAGAAAGLFAGGLAATVYGLHCPEHTMAFIAVWYSLGVGLVVALGATVGPWALRWR